MIDHPLISVIIPVYNVESYIVEALESVIHQTYENLEILVIDDGSTDGSGVICDKYARDDARIFVIHQENKGLSSARNVGLDRMTGDAVAFLDPDDAYEVAFIEKLLAPMLMEDADVTVCKFSVHHTTGKLKRDGERVLPLSAAGIYNHNSGLCALTDRSINVSVWNKLYHRKLWQEIRFPDGHVYEDIDTTFRVFDLCNKIVVLDEPLYLQRKRSGSITDTFSLNYIYDRYLAYSHFSAFIEEHKHEIFTPAQSKNWQQYTFSSMIVCYIVASRAGRETYAFCKKLREQIISAGKEQDIDALGFKIKAAWYMVYHCPWLLKIIYPIYLRIKSIVCRVTGRNKDA